MKVSGRIRYDRWQHAADPACFAMVAVWENGDALEKHRALPSRQEAVGRLMPMARERSRIQRLGALTGDG